MEDFKNQLIEKLKDKLTEESIEDAFLAVGLDQDDVLEDALNAKLESMSIDQLIDLI
jgi:ribosomal protein L12E/L44/L45/RPP1/RPP2